MKGSCRICPRLAFLAFLAIGAGTQACDCGLDLDFDFDLGCFPVIRCADGLCHQCCTSTDCSEGRVCCDYDCADCCADADCGSGQHCCDGQCQECCESRTCPNYPDQRCSMDKLCEPPCYQEGEDCSQKPSLCCEGLK